MSITQHRPEELRKIASAIRGRLVEMSHKAGTPHLGSALSCADILVAAYWNILKIDPTKPGDELRDRFILSKGHAATVLYAVLAERGFFPKTLLDSFAQEGSPLAEQPAPNCAPGVELATGSLGHGLPVGIGMALAARIRNLDYRVIVAMSDGECNEGSVWEGAMFAAAQALGKLTVIIDYNKWQATGRSNEVMALPSLREKWAAFGWKALEIDGHDIQAITEALAQTGAEDRPLAIIANTVKGRGVSFMEDDNNWHYRIPTDKEVVAARKELGLE
ncbi:MAG TPA: transketolase [Chthoniobacteraceae bacterium]|nr:transketolase [Chthoniobacteraceae bacterium]